MSAPAPGSAARPRRPGGTGSVQLRGARTAAGRSTDQLDVAESQVHMHAFSRLLALPYVLRHRKEGSAGPLPPDAGLPGSAIDRGDDRGAPPRFGDGWREVFRHGRKGPAALAFDAKERGRELDFVRHVQELIRGQRIDAPCPTDASCFSGLLSRDPLSTRCLRRSTASALFGEMSAQTCAAVRRSCGSRESMGGPSPLQRAQVGGVRGTEETRVRLPDTGNASYAGTGGVTRSRSTIRSARY